MADTSRLQLENKIRSNLYTRGGSDLRNSVILVDMIVAVERGEIRDALNIIYNEVFIGHNDYADAGAQFLFQEELDEVRSVASINQNRETW